jgi:hypothetical protein
MSGSTTRRGGYWRMIGTNHCTHGSIIIMANNKKRRERILNKTLHMMHLDGFITIIYMTKE